LLRDFFATDFFSAFGAVAAVFFTAFPNTRSHPDAKFFDVPV